MLASYRHAGSVVHQLHIIHSSASIGLCRVTQSITDNPCGIPLCMQRHGKEGGHKTECAQLAAVESGADWHSSDRSLVMQK